MQHQLKTVTTIKYFLIYTPISVFKERFEIDESIIQTAVTLNRNPFRGRIEDYLKEMNEEIRFILFKETKHFELKIIYFIDDKNRIVYITNFFPTKMHPQEMENL